MSECVIELPEQNHFFKLWQCINYSIDYTYGREKRKRTGLVLLNSVHPFGLLPTFTIAL